MARYYKSRNFQGLIWCAVFVVLDSAQAVYLGATLQRIDGFLLGGLVFGFSALICFGCTYIRAPEQFRLAYRNWKTILHLNITVALGWILYFGAVQIVEPAVAFTLFTGAIPIVTGVAGILGSQLGEAPRNRYEWLGNTILFIAIAYLCFVSITGLSGFVRGGPYEAALGCTFALGGGVFIAYMLLLGQALDRKGLDPVTQFGFRFPLYLLISGIAVLVGVDSKGPLVVNELVVAFALGLLLLAFPIFAVQKAISLTTPLTIGASAATAPAFIFALQLLEGRVETSVPTLVGLLVFFLGSILGVFGATLTIREDSA